MVSIFIGIFGSNRNQKERKGKKADTKSTNNAKHYKTSQSHQGTRDGPGGVHLQNSNAKADNHDNILPHRSTIDNKKCVNIFIKKCKFPYFSFISRSQHPNPTHNPMFR